MSSIALKRSWSRINAGNQEISGEQTDELPSHSGVPPLPKINGETLLQVLTHRSLRRPEEASGSFDNERLAELGAKVLDTAITAALFHRRPILSGPEMLAQRKSILSEENLDSWVSMYCLREKMRCAREMTSSLKSPEETRIIFEAYVGGIYEEQGLEPVQHWLDKLTHDNTRVKSFVSTRSSPLSTNPIATHSTARPPPYNAPPQKRVKTDSPIFIAAQPYPSSSQFMPTTVFPNGQTQYSTNPEPFLNPLAPAQPHLAFLPLFNQTAAQRRVTVDYPANCSGPSHAPRWTVQCKVNGIMKGTGAGKSKQEAKELAAREAWFNLGWS
ncbi:ribonuclease III domain-containing protein [Lentinula aciculospora]|uniref:Ribonuclease III domain-containing protein n=1 Tax=Lentinula aciculospora TaxID=153920 RepID=A0A9W9DUB1_9AGAR|nr:ribonuclease III domain-containing protein [Lentinula aciculospora]